MGQTACSPLLTAQPAGFALQVIATLFARVPNFPAASQRSMAKLSVCPLFLRGNGFGIWAGGRTQCRIT